jgi:hypothetical protein
MKAASLGCMAGQGGLRGSKGPIGMTRDATLSRACDRAGKAMAWVVLRPRLPPGKALLAAAAHADEQCMTAGAGDDAADPRHVLHRVVKQDQVHHCKYSTWAAMCAQEMRSETYRPTAANAASPVVTVLYEGLRNRTCIGLVVFQQRLGQHLVQVGEVGHLGWGWDARRTCDKGSAAGPHKFVWLEAVRWRPVPGGQRSRMRHNAEMRSLPHLIIGLVCQTAGKVAEHEGSGVLLPVVLVNVWKIVGGQSRDPGWRIILSLEPLTTGSAPKLHTDPFSARTRKRQVLLGNCHG